ncbi:tetratricopeptide repeat protein [Cystobacter fuscus]|uniref:tetratricopeptide repeat protein n=1 Tax=Cystobacter fuscus TaxID=43 RepID=UPI002B2D9726|nr:tetratricopeptide repeat protein [Cystobacter fuscus]
MATSNATPGGPRGGRGRQGFRVALLQVGLVALLFAGAVAYLVHQGSVRREVNTRLKAARALSVRDNPADLRQALVELDALFLLDDQVKDAQALAADVNTRLWLEHQQPEAQARAREHQARAEALDSRSGERYGTHARLLLAEGKTEEAGKYLEELQAQGAKNTKLALAEAQVLLTRGRLAEARQALARASEAAWREPRYAQAHGEALLDEGLAAQAAEAFRKATLASPGHLRARLSLALARLYQGTGQEEARKTVADVLSREAELSPPLKARALSVRAALALAEERPDEALEAAGEALAASPDEYQALFLRARALARRGDKGAREAFLAAVERRRTAPLLYLEGARVLREARDGEGALKLLDAYAAVFRDVRVPAGEGQQVSALERDERYWLARGEVMEALARGDAALEAYDRALAIKGVGRARAQYAKAALLLSRGDAASARPLLAELTPENGMGALPEAYEAMGRLLFAQGEFAQGCQHYYVGLSRAHQQGAAPEALQRKAVDVERRLTDSGQATMARTWKTEADALLRQVGGL